MQYGLPAMSAPRLSACSVSASCDSFSASFSASAMSASSNGTGIFCSESAASFARDFDPSGCRTHLKDCEMMCASRFDSSVMRRRSALLFAGKMTSLRYVAISVSRSLTISCFTSLKIAALANAGAMAIFFCTFFDRHALYMMCKASGAMSSTWYLSSQRSAISAALRSRVEVGIALSPMLFLRGDAAFAGGAGSGRAFFAVAKCHCVVFSSRSSVAILRFKSTFSAASSASGSPRSPGIRAARSQSPAKVRKHARESGLGGGRGYAQCSHAHMYTGTHAHFSFHPELAPGWFEHVIIQIARHGTRR
mmetsp:Transcript_34952/g.91763  ORF Transcript_34952/g.91763 Transcript_34952/m.91763 type:complete len:307 (-) Transcript_34952:971-1891(-)